MLYAATDGPVSDEELALRYSRDGNQAAFTELSRRMAPMSRRLFLALFCGSAADAEDAEQETLVALITALRRFDGRSSAKTYWYRVARNTGVTILRRRGRQRRVREKLSMPGVSTETRPTADPEQLLLEKEAVHEYFRMLDTLPETDRLLLHLFYVEEHSISHTAEVLGMKQGTVKSKLHRIRRRLQRQGKRER